MYMVSCCLMSLKKGLMKVSCQVNIATNLYECKWNSSRYMWQNICSQLDTHLLKMGMDGLKIWCYILDINLSVKGLMMR